VLWRRNQRREIKNGILNTNLNFYKSLLKKKRLYETMFNFEYTGIFKKNWTFLESYYSATKYHMNIQYAPNFRTSIVFSPGVWHLKSAVISVTMGLPVTD
jgi:hypothetical protein